MNSCLQHIKKDVLQDAFVFTYTIMKRYEGAWHTEERPMFPNYVFLESDHGDRLSDELEQYRQAVQVLETDDLLQSIRPEEEHFLKALCGNGHHMTMSRGYIRGQRTYITEGPLKGKEALIRKIDRHKRLAMLELPMFQRPKQVSAGLEIYTKE